MIVRDSNNLIGQHDPYNLAYLDHGDCPRSTGMMALGGSWEDVHNLWKLCTHERKLVRHPTQEPHCRPEETSRDQLICWAAAISLIPSLPQQRAASECVHKYAKSWFINKDLLMPDVRLFLYRACYKPPPPHILLLGYVLLPLTILWAAFVHPEHELNQIIAQLSKFHPLWLKALIKLHPNFYKNIEDYYCGWRDQRQIYEHIVRHVRMRIGEE